MIFSWLRRRRRRALLREPVPDRWFDIVSNNVHQYEALSAGERARLFDDVRILVAEKNWEGCGGLAINDEVKVTIAAAASLLLLGFENEYFDAVQSILVYPDAYVAPGHSIAKGGLVLEGDSHREGEAWYRGPVILSWADTLAGGRGHTPGYNLVLHEFAHQLDMQNGRIVDGTPPLSSRTEYDRWQQVIQCESERLERDCARDRPTLLDCYGLASLGEFFAVSTECFFERPREMQREHPELYQILRDYYRQNPADREAGVG